MKKIILILLLVVCLVAPQVASAKITAQDILDYLDNLSDSFPLLAPVFNFFRGFVVDEMNRNPQPVEEEEPVKTFDDNQCKYLSVSLETMDGKPINSSSVLPKNSFYSLPPAGPGEYRILVPCGTNTSALTAVFSFKGACRVDPDPKEMHDFSGPVSFTASPIFGSKDEELITGQTTTIIIEAIEGEYAGWDVSPEKARAMGCPI